MKSSKFTVPILVNWSDIQAYMEQHDIVEVVRCKDCKRRKQDLFCIWSMPDDNWFCADGEKETES